MAELSLTNVVSVSVMPSVSGLSEFNTANLLLLTTDTPNFSFDGDYQFYKDASTVAEDFGSNSLTYKMAVSVFQQAPNILSNNGSLIIAPKRNEESQVDAFNRLKAQVLFCGFMTTIAPEDDLEENEGSVNAEIKATVAPSSVEDIKGLSNPSITITTDSDEKTISFDFSEEESYEDIAGNIQTAINESGLQDMYCYFGEDGKFVIGSGFYSEIEVNNTDLTSALKVNSGSNPETTVAKSSISDTINSYNNKINFIVSNNTNDIEGTFKDVKDRSNEKTRCLYYGGNDWKDSKVMMAGYASRAMSTVFNGSLTTQTMHLKEIIGTTVDSTMTQTLLEKCKQNGVDTYVSIEGSPCIFSTGANQFFDDVFNKVWFVNAIQTAGFNYLKTTGTKIPQTETGMIGLKNAYRRICLQAVTNGYVEAGSWTLPDTFGDPDTFKRNIEGSGYYIYSIPITKQSKEEREERKAPLVQIAIKLAGAIHSTSVIITINK